MSMRATIIKAASAVSAAGVLIGAVFAVDQRYVSADEFKKQIFVVKETVTDLRRSRLEDEIFKLELIPEKKRSESDKAMLDRYKGQLREIDFRRERER